MSGLLMGYFSVFLLAIIQTAGKPPAAEPAPGFPIGSGVFRLHSFRCEPDPCRAELNPENPRQDILVGSVAARSLKIMPSWRNQSSSGQLLRKTNRIFDSGYDFHFRLCLSDASGVTVEDFRIDDVDGEKTSTINVIYWKLVDLVQRLNPKFPILFEDESLRIGAFVTELHPYRVKIRLADDRGIAQSIQFTIMPLR